MSNLWFNIRFGTRHLQFGPEDKLSFHVNPYWVVNLPTKWFAIYQLFGISFSGE